MKNWTWKQWTGFGIIVAVIIVGVICHLVQPQVSYAYFEMIVGGAFVAGGFAGYLLKKNNIVNKPDKKQLLKD
jgi:hypothetical protein